MRFNLICTLIHLNIYKLRCIQCIQTRPQSGNSSLTQKRGWGRGTIEGGEEESIQGSEGGGVHGAVGSHPAGEATICSSLCLAHFSD